MTYVWLGGAAGGSLAVKEIEAMKRRVAQMEEEAAKIEQIQQETNKALVKPSGRELLASTDLAGRAWFSCVVMCVSCLFILCRALRSCCRSGGGR